MTAAFRLDLRCKKHRKLMKGSGWWWIMKTRHFHSKIMGSHQRWWALGQYALKFGKPCPDVKRFLLNVDFVGVDGAIEMESW